MLKFVDLKQKLLKKEERIKEKVILRRFINYITNKAADNQKMFSVWSAFLPNSLPVGNNIPDWLKLTAEGQQEAYEV